MIGFGSFPEVMAISLSIYSVHEQKYYLVLMIDYTILT